MTKVLEGIKVVEQGTFITGPACRMLLGDLGADVVKVEQPGSGDPFRAFKGGLYSPHFQTYNRNKRSIALDSKNGDDRAVLDALIGEADVYIQNFRPGVADKLGVGAVRLRALNPRLVYASISGFGATGPAAARPAYDTVAQAASGFLKLLVNPENPRVVGPAIADALTGFYAAYGILGALVERGRTGVGRTVEVSMLEAMAHFNLDAFTHFFQADEVMGPYSRPRVSQSYVLECSDGKWIALHMSSPEKFWHGLAQAIEQPGLFDDARFATREARIDHQEALIELLGAKLRAAPARRMVRAARAARRAARADVRHQRGAARPAGRAPAAHGVGRASGDGALQDRAFAGLVRRRARARRAAAADARRARRRDPERTAEIPNEGDEAP